MNILFIAGMHRSGTSWLAKEMHESGVHVGHTLLGATKENALGHYEDRLMLTLNEQMLHKAGATWANPVTIDETIAPVEQLRLALINGREYENWIGFKDPRLCWTIPAWMDVFPEARIIATVRRPSEVAASLQARDGLTYRSSVTLWESAYENLLEYVDDLTVHFVAFPSQAGLVYAKEALGLNAPGEGAYEPSLIHHDHEEQAPSDSVFDRANGMYEELMDIITERELIQVEG